MTFHQILPYLIVCPLTFLAGFVDAIGGGGGLISLPAYMIAGLPVHMAIGTNKMSAGMGTLVATTRLALHGHIHLKQTVGCVVTAVVGSALGARLALIVDAEIFKRIMLVIIPITAFFVFRSRSMEKPRLELPRAKMLRRAMAVALGIGVYDGFYGPGTGTFLILLLTSFAGFALTDANGVAKSINLTTNITGTVVFLLGGTVIIPLALTAGVCSIAGNYIGISFFESKGSRAVKPIMLCVLTVFFIKILTELKA